VTVVGLDSTVQRAPGAKVRILETANHLFHEDGIRIVGVDRLITESHVTKATFYKHYGSKDRLILEYITSRARTERSDLTAMVQRNSNAEISLREYIDHILADMVKPGFRGCAFINAATEFADPLHPVRGVVRAHRDWLMGFLSDLLADLGHRLPGDAADELLLARDGAMSGGYAGDPIAASAALSRVSNRLIAAAADH
jgi:AcrR family transcriptional regulator